jgi:hypothetical protein
LTGRLSQRWRYAAVYEWSGLDTVVSDRSDARLPDATHFARPSRRAHGTALDKLNLAQKLGLVSDPDAWLAMRLLRDRGYTHTSTTWLSWPPRCSVRASSARRMSPAGAMSAST